jgi:hypothetical protein
MSLIIPANTLASGGYDVANSLMFDGVDSYLNITSGSSPTSTKKFTVSFWLKRSKLGREQHIFGGVSAAQCYFVSDDRLRFADTTSGTNYYTTQKFRDVSAWYHIVIAVDTTLGTAGDRARIYVNGSEITAFDTETNATQNNNTAYNIGSTTYVIGRYNPSQAQNYYYSGYMAEYVFIDGQQLDPTSFGEFDSDSNIWKPIDVSGLTFGTNGYYLDFEDSAALGDDVSGNGNDFTVNNLTAIDQTTDTPTNNFATLNAVSNPTNGYTLSNGNLEATVTGSSFTRQYIVNTIAPTSGKWYWESKLITSGGSDRTRLGICSYEENIGTGTTFPANAVSIATGYSRIRFTENGDGSNNGGGNTTEVDSFYTVPTANDIFMYALDLDNTKFYFGINGTWWDYATAETGGDPTSGSGYVTNSTNIIKGAMSLYIDVYAGAVSTTFTNQFNFGNAPYTISSGNTDGNGYGNFEYAVPSGYLSLCTANLSEVLG